MSPSICNTQERMVSGVLSLYFRDVNVDRCLPFYSQRKQTPRYVSYSIFDQVTKPNLAKDEPKKHTTTHQRLRELVRGEYSTRFHEKLERLERLHLISCQAYELISLTRPKPSGSGTNFVGNSGETEDALMDLLCLMLSTNEGVDCFFKQLKKEEDIQKRIEIVEDLFYFISENTSSLKETNSLHVDFVDIPYLFKSLANQSYIDKDTKNSIIIDFLDKLQDRISEQPKVKGLFRSNNLSRFLEYLLFNFGSEEMIYLNNPYDPIYSKILSKTIKILVQSQPPIQPYTLSLCLYFLKSCYPEVIHDKNYEEASTITANYTARYLLDNDGPFIMFGDSREP